MGSEEQLVPSESRKGDTVAKAVALASIWTFLGVTWWMTFMSGATFYWFSWHPLLQSVGIAAFSYGILTLQPTSRPKSKADGLSRHQALMLGLGFPSVIIGCLAIYVNKEKHGSAHFTTWHGTIGSVTLLLLTIQIAVGGGNVWFDGSLFGGNPKAKLAWKYHRLVGYITFLFLLFSVYLGGAHSSWSVNHSAGFARLLAYAVAPVLLLAAIYSRIRLSKMRLF